MVRFLCPRTERSPIISSEARWVDALGREVDLDNIDREYALNILSMVLLRRGRLGLSDDDIRNDPLVQKLRDVVLTGRKPNLSDRLRAMDYNVRNRLAGKSFRAPLR